MYHNAPSFNARLLFVLLHEQLFQLQSFDTAVDQLVSLNIQQTSAINLSYSVQAIHNVILEIIY